jgi:hypothetical protein
MSDENKQARPFISDRAWTAVTYLALIGGVLGAIAVHLRRADQATDRAVHRDHRDNRGGVRHAAFPVAG